MVNVLKSLAVIFLLSGNVFASSEGGYLNLPFPYRSLTEHDRANSVFVPELCYTLLSPESGIHSAVVGPLRPCVLLAIRNAAKDTAIIFHLSHFNTVENVLSIIEREFGDGVESSLLTVKLFTTSIEHIPPSALKGSLVSPATQRDFLVKIMDAVSEKYKLTKHQVKAILYKTSSDDTPSFFYGATRTVFIDKNLSIASVSAIQERLFLDEPLTMVGAMKPASCMNAYNALIVRDYLRRFSFPRALQKPFPLVFIPPSEMGLEKIREIVKS